MPMCLSPIKLSILCLQGIDCGVKMKKLLKITCAAGLILLPIGLKAEEITLVCKYDGGAEMMPIKVNLKTKNVEFGQVQGGGWRLVGNLDRYITMRSPDTQSSIGGTVMVVDRFSGEFVISNASASTDEKIIGFTHKGFCNKKQF
jgi:hypothetical protein